MQALRYATSASAGALRAAALRPVARAYSAGAGSLHKAQLGNGVTVISDDSASSPVATISVVVKAGSAYETHETHGAAHFAKLLALKSNQSLSALRVTRLIENHSASFEVKHSREAITYTVKSLQEDVGPVCEVLAAMMKPLAQEYELRDLRELVNNECAANVANSESRAADLVHSAVFRGQGLGRSVVCPTYNRAISSDLMGEYVESSFVGERITVVGLGVDKARFTEGAQAFAVLARGSAAAPASSETSFGGEVLESAGSGTRAVLAYPMGNAAPAEAYTALTILGGHLQANKTSPGEGVTSRLYQNVLAKNPSVRTASAVYHNNCVQPLVGVTGFAPGSGKASELVNALHAEVKGLSNVSDEEIKRASATCAMKVHQWGEDKASYAEYLGARGQQHTPAELAANVAAVQPATVRSAIKEMFSAKPTLVVVGDVSGAPKL